MFGALRHIPVAIKRLATRKAPAASPSGTDADDEAAATKLFSIHAVASKGPLKARQTWREGLIFQRGSHENSNFEPRLITLKTEYLIMTKPEDAMLDVIYFHEIVGVVRAGMEESLFAMNFLSEESYPDENALGREILQTLEFTDLAIITTSGGYHKGRVYVFRASTTYEMDVWTCSIARVLQNHGDAPPVPAREPAHASMHQGSGDGLYLSFALLLPSVGTHASWRSPGCSGGACPTRQRKDRACTHRALLPCSERLPCKRQCPALRALHPRNALAG